MASFRQATARQVHFVFGTSDMVVYFTSAEGHTIYMGKDKFENEDLIHYGFLEDIWFHVDDLSSAHVYLRLPLGQTTLDDVSATCLEECAQLVKDNSIEGRKKKSVSVCYTRWRNLNKTASMEVGQVGFKHPERVRHYKVMEKNMDVVKRLNRTKQELYPDLEEERQQRELLYKSERKKQRLHLETMERKEKQEYKQEKELRSYSIESTTEEIKWSNFCVNLRQQNAWNIRSLMMSREKVDSNKKVEASADLSSVKAYEEDFM